VSGQRVGYIRVSTLDQSTARQLDGVTLDRTFVDKASGKDVARPQLEAMVGFVPLAWGLLVSGVKTAANASTKSA